MSAKFLYSTDFLSFLLRVCRLLGIEVEQELYLRYLAGELQTLGDQEGARMIVNLPPRHLKTVIFSIAYVAWRLARKPALRVMIISHNDDLAGDIASKLMAVVASPWFSETFGVQLSKSKRGAKDFATTAGGACFCASIRSGITGRGADLMIIDDPVDIAFADDEAVHEEVADIFASKLRNRLDNPASGSIILVAHRLHERDLSGEFLKQGGWRQIKLSFQATDSVEVSPDFHRAAGSILRPSAFTPALVDEIKSSRNFSALYQQQPGGDPALRIAPEWLISWDALPSNSHVISVDCAGSVGPGSSFSSVQAWTRHGDQFFLVDCRRGRWAFEELVATTISMKRRQTPAAILIERNSYGIALLERLKLRNPVVPIVPTASKVERVQKHLGLLRGGAVLFPPDFALRFPEFHADLLAFPRSASFDDIDAMSQALDWLVKQGTLPPTPKRAVGARPLGNGMSEFA